MASERRHWPFALATVAVAWFAALGIEMLARFANQMYMAGGIDLPGPTLVARDAVRDYFIPWLIAAAVSLLLIALWLMRSAYLAHAAAAVALVVAIGAASACVAFSLPLVRHCMEYALPDWSPGSCR